MTEDEEALVESMARLLAEGGLPRVAGRMWAWLLICDPPQQTAAQLAETLQASRGAISGAARLLEGVGLVTRSTRRGERREYFAVQPGSLIEVMRARQASVRAGRELAARGLDLLRDRPPADRARIQEVHDLYAFMERELPALLARYPDRRKDAAT